VEVEAAENGDGIIFHGIFQWDVDMLPTIRSFGYLKNWGYPIDSQLNWERSDHVIVA
jgi:hypothetical protein